MSMIGVPVSVVDLAVTAMSTTVCSVRMGARIVSTTITVLTAVMIRNVFTITAVTNAQSRWNCDAPMVDSSLRLSTVEGATGAS